MASIAEPGQPAAAEQVSILDLPVDPSTPLFRVRPFRQLFITRVASTTAVQMLAVAVGWHVYELTDSALHLGMIGLVQVLPPVVLMLVIGQVADRINRRLVLRWCYVFAVLSSVGLVVVSMRPHPSIPAIYALLLANSTARVFEQPVMQALLSVMAPRAILNRAIAAHVSARQISVLIGPSLGGVLYVFGAPFDYSVCALLFLAASAGSFRLPKPPDPTEHRKVSWETLWRASASSAAASPCSAPCCSIWCRRCSAASMRCCRSTRATSSRSGPGAPVSCAARPPSAH